MAAFSLSLSQVLLFRTHVINSIDGKFNNKNQQKGQSKRRKSFKIISLELSIICNRILEHRPSRNWRALMCYYVIIYINANSSALQGKCPRRRYMRWCPQSDMAQCINNEAVTSISFLTPHVADLRTSKTWSSDSYLAVQKLWRVSVSLRSE